MVAVQDDCCPLEDDKLSLSNSTHFSCKTSSKHLSNSIHDLMMSQAEISLPSTHSSKEGSYSLSPDNDNLEPWKYIQPPDVGYSWVVLACCVILQFGSGLLTASVGLLYVEWIEKFQKGEGPTAWISTSQTSILYLFAPVIALIADRIGHRCIAMIGCIGMGFCGAAASMVTTFEALLITYGILAGLFKGCVLIPTTVTTASYFQKYRVLTLAITTSCNPLMYMIISPVMAKLIELYGWRVSNMWSAAAVIQCTVFAALLRPQKLAKRESTRELNDIHSATSVKLRESSYSSSEESSQEEDGQDENVPLQAEVISTEDQHSLKLGNLKKTFPPAGDVNKSTQGKGTALLYRIRQLSVCHWRTVILLASNFTWGWGITTFLILLPDHAKSRGINNTQIGQLFMIFGALGLGGRLATVTLCKVQKNFSKGATVLIGMIVQAAALLGLSIANTFTGFALMAGAHSVTYGVCTCLATPTILELHGERGIGMVFSLEMLMYGIGSYLSAPFAAYNVKVFGSYEFGFQFAAALTLIGGLVYLPHVAVQYIKGRKEQSSAAGI